ncbi:Metallo-dependent phosphatase [Infundibulicybe gibba]|nr:Metallo-dependent phosphatase [Infundibulicybe gibba]
MNTDALSKISLHSPVAIVHSQYDINSPPPAPGQEEWTRFVCLSDSHSRTFEVPDGDVLLHGGDLTNTGTLAEFRKTIEWLCSLPHKRKIIIAGNHDLTLDSEWYDCNYVRWHSREGKQDFQSIMDLLKGPDAVDAGLVYLQDEEYKFQAKPGGKWWSVYGADGLHGQWSPEFYNWAFSYKRENAEGIMSKIPKTDILLTHGPPYGIFDRITQGADVGCPNLRAHLSRLRPRLHLVGHIHEARGAYIHEWNTLSTSEEPPVVQNDTEFTEHDASESSSGSTSIPSGVGTEDSKPGQPETTVFVNAANWPSAKTARAVNVRGLFGGPGVQPVIVDMKEF